MKFIINPKQFSVSYPQFLRQAGYTYIQDRRSGLTSFARTLGKGNYPRFHIYVDEYDDGRLAFKIHLDQKQASYEGTTAHSGEYNDGPVLEEVERLKSMLSTKSSAKKPKTESSNPWSAFKK